jgi:hypothetical protein
MPSEENPNEDNACEDRCGRLHAGSDPSIAVNRAKHWLKNQKEEAEVSDPEDNEALLSKKHPAFTMEADAGQQIPCKLSSFPLEDFFEDALGRNNDFRSKQAKDALKSEGFKSLDDLKSRVKCVGDLVRMGVPFPQAKLVWKAISGNHKKIQPGTASSVPTLPTLPGIKIHETLFEWCVVPAVDCF